MRTVPFGLFLFCIGQVLGGGSTPVPSAPKNRAPHALRRKKTAFARHLTWGIPTALALLGAVTYKKYKSRAQAEDDIEKVGEENKLPKAKETPEKVPAQIKKQKKLTPRQEVDEALKAWEEGLKLCAKKGISPYLGQASDAGIARWIEEEEEQHAVACFRLLFTDPQTGKEANSIYDLVPEEDRSLYAEMAKQAFAKGCAGNDVLWAVIGTFLQAQPMARGPLTAYALLHQPWLRYCIESNKPDLTLYLAEKCRKPLPLGKVREYDVWSHYQHDPLFCRLEAFSNGDDLTAAHAPLVQEAQRYLTDRCMEIDKYPFAQGNDWINLKENYKEVCTRLEEKLTALSKGATA